jgi:hypothetical protein
MAFNLYDFRRILNTTNDILFMSEDRYSIEISTGYDEDEYGHESTFIKLTFPLENGIVEIRVYDAIGFVIYTSNNGEILKNIEFREDSISETNSSFKKAIKTSIAFDRQKDSSREDPGTSTDRASFELAQVN